MYRPQYHEPHNDQDWEEHYAEVVEPEPLAVPTLQVGTRVIEDHGDFAISRSARISNERLIADYQQPDARELMRQGLCEAIETAGGDLIDSVIVEVPVDAPKSKFIVYDDQQQQAIRYAEEHLFSNISGTAGTGKTFVSKEIMRRGQGAVVLAATTGIASVNLGEGTTINALLHYFNTQQLTTMHMEGQLVRVISHLRRSGIHRILIDEKSMMAGPQLTAITRAVRESNEGGVYALEEVGTGEGATPDQSRKRPEPAMMGIVLVGDFGQLPPVPDSVEEKDPQTGEKKWKKLPVQFAFDSPEWELFAEHTTVLTRIYRQEAIDFVSALHAVRAGRIMDALKFFTPDRFVPVQDDTFDGTTIYAKNDQVDRYNQMRLDLLPGQKMIARSIRNGEQRTDWKNIPETLVLKEGALVMLLANRRIYDDSDKPTMVYANGDQAHLVGKDPMGIWLAHLKRTGKTVQVYPVTRENLIPLVSGRKKQIKLEVRAAMAKDGFKHTELLNEDDYDEETSYARAGRQKDLWEDESMDDVELEKARAKQEFEARLAKRINDEGKGKFEIIGDITYMPLRAGYASTVHKTQGLTLDHVQVNIRDPFFKQPGMLFVALSRAKTADGLRIVADQKTFVERCRIEPRVQKWL